MDKKTPDKRIEDLNNATCKPLRQIAPLTQHTRASPSFLPKSGQTDMSKIRYKQQLHEQNTKIEMINTTYKSNKYRSAQHKQKRPIETETRAKIKFRNRNRIQK